MAMSSKQQAASSGSDKCSLTSVSARENSTAGLRKRYDDGRSMVMMERKPPSPKASAALLKLARRSFSGDGRHRTDPRREGGAKVVGTGLHISNFSSSRQLGERDVPQY
jgi:hypothetical protein